MVNGDPYDICTASICYTHILNTNSDSVDPYGTFAFSLTDSDVDPGGSCDFRIYCRWLL